MKYFSIIFMLLILFTHSSWTQADEFRGHSITDTFDGVKSVYAADIDGDGDVDILGAASNAGAIAWWENDGNQIFTKHTIIESVETFGGAISVYAADVDSDGDVDILGTAKDADVIAWWENNSNQQFTKHIIDDAFNGAWAVLTIDMDDDGDVDILGAANNADDIAWWENDGYQNFTKHIIAGNFNGPRGVYAVDIDRDGDIDVIGAGFSADAILWWTNDGSEFFAEHILTYSFDGATAVYATDIDGDKDIDILGAASNADVIAWWENDGHQNFTEHTLIDDFNGARAVYATDIDNDGDVDILGAASNADDIRWWENDGSQNFTEHTLIDDFDGAWAVYPMDIDSDSDVDILGAAANDDSIIWWEHIRTPIPGDVSGDWTVSAHDAALILQYVVGLIDTFPVESIDSPSSSAPRDYELRLPNLMQATTEKIYVPITINNTTGLVAGSICLQYNPAILKAVDVLPTIKLKGSYWDANTERPGEVRFAFATAEPTGGGGNLLIIEFEVLPNTEGHVSPLTLADVNLSNSMAITTIHGSLTVLPLRTALLQNYPNPFNPETWLPYQLAEPAFVVIKIYNAYGQIVRAFRVGHQEAGSYITPDQAAYWDGRDNYGEIVASGIYLYALHAGNFTTVRRMILVK